MHKPTFVLLAAGFLAFAAALPASGQSSTASTVLQVNVQAEASISIPASSYTFVQTGTGFSNYTLTMPFTFRIRTSRVGGSGSVVATFANDFVGAAGGSGPSIASGHLTYTSASSGVGVGQSSAVTAVVGGAGTNVLAFGANNRSTGSGTNAQINWVLANLPDFETDTYTTTVVLTISAS
ncbi:MAG: hypothetical protein N2036_07420 [Bryobacteraceae bacterium]|nr:hypothetical protein [Bryobacteraceae bacterium]